MPSERRTLDTACKTVHRRRRVSKTRARPEIDRHVPFDDSGDRDSDRQVASSRNKNRWLLRKHGHKVTEESGMGRARLEEAAESGDFAMSRVKERRLSKDFVRLANDYRKLDKKYECIQEEYQKLNSVLERRETEYQLMCSRYESLVGAFQEMEDTTTTLALRNQALEIENVRSSEDITLLKNVVYQLNSELERYQDRMGKQRANCCKESANDFKSYSNSNSTNRWRTSEERDVSTFESWGRVTLHALGPLLNAYEESLAEKRELVAMYEERLADFGNRCKEIVMENERMHKEVEHLGAKCDRYTDEIEALVENSWSLQKRLDLLVKEAASRKRHTDQVQSSYERKMESILERNETLRKQYEYSVTELSNVRGRCEILSREFEKLKTREKDSVPVVVHTTAIEECTRLLGELKHRYETEKKNLSDQIKRIEEIRPVDEQQLATVTAERNHLKVLTKQLERKLKHALRRTERMQIVACSTRAARDSIKERLNKAIACCEELFFEYERIAAEREKLLTLLHETEKDNASIDRIGKTVADRINGLKKQLEIVRRGAKQQVATAEKRMRLQEFRVRRMKREYRRKVRHLRNIVRQKEHTIGKLQKEKHMAGENLVQADQDTKVTGKNT